MSTMDKASWGAGPWTDEPDRVDWMHAGLPCLALRNRDGVWCGYAAVPPGHPWHGRSYHNLNVEVHGGLTYSGACRGEICHAPAPGEPDDVWWVGFDTGHCCDYAPGVEARLRGAPGELGYRSPYDHAAAVAADDWCIETYRTLAYVEAE